MCGLLFTSSVYAMRPSEGEEEWQKKFDSKKRELSEEKSTQKNDLKDVVKNLLRLMTIEIDMQHLAYISYDFFKDSERSLGKSKSVSLDDREGGVALHGAMEKIKDRLLSQEDISTSDGFEKGINQYFKMGQDEVKRKWLKLNIYLVSIKEMEKYYSNIIKEESKRPVDVLHERLVRVEPLLHSHFDKKTLEKVRAGILLPLWEGRLKDLGEDVDFEVGASFNVYKILKIKDFDIKEELRKTKSSYESLLDKKEEGFFGFLNKPRNEELYSWTVKFDDLFKIAEENEQRLSRMNKALPVFQGANKKVWDLFKKLNESQILQTKLLETAEGRWVSFPGYEEQQRLLPKILSDDISQALDKFKSLDEGLNEIGEKLKSLK